MSNNRLVYMNGEFVKEAEAKISIFDSALMFGDMVFEMTRSFNGKQFKLREHLEIFTLLDSPADIALSFTCSTIRFDIIKLITLKKRKI